MIILQVLSVFVIIEMLRLQLTAFQVIILILDALIFPLFLIQLFANKPSFKLQLNAWVSYRQKSLIGLFFKIIFRYV